MRTRPGMMSFCLNIAFYYASLTVIPDGMGDPYAYIPYTRLFGRSYRPGEPSSVFGVFYLRHIRFVTAKVEHKLKHGGERFSVIFPAAYVSYFYPVPSEQVIQLIYAVHRVS